MQKIISKLFGEKEPTDKVVKWISSVKLMSKTLYKKLGSLDAQEKTLTRELKSAIKREKVGERKYLAGLMIELKEKKSIYKNAAADLERLYKQLNRINYSASWMQPEDKFNEDVLVFETVYTLIRIEELAETVKKMSKEMLKVGLIDIGYEDLLNDAYEEGQQNQEYVHIQHNPEDLENVVADYDSDVIGQASETTGSQTSSRKGHRTSSNSLIQVHPQSTSLMLETEVPDLPLIPTINPQYSGRFAYNTVQVMPCVPEVSDASTYEFSGPRRSSRPRRATNQTAVQEESPPIQHNSTNNLANNNLKQTDQNDKPKQTVIKCNQEKTTLQERRLSAQKRSIGKADVPKAIAEQETEFQKKKQAKN